MIMGSTSIKVGGSIGGDRGIVGGGFSCSSYQESGGSSSLVLDGERGKLIVAPPHTSHVKNTVTAKKGVAGLTERGGLGDVKALIALKNHSEAERRRRERINSHLSILRGLLPRDKIKLDKASLLAEVISHLKELQRQAKEVSLKHMIPSDDNEIRVELVDGGGTGGSCLIKASLCCEDHPDLITELKKTLEPLKLRTLSAEMSTIRTRVRHVFIVASPCTDTDIEKHLLKSSLRRCLESVLSRFPSQEDLLVNGSQPAKRRRTSQRESSSFSFR